MIIPMILALLFTVAQTAIPKNKTPVYDVQTRELHEVR